MKKLTLNGMCNDDCPCKGCVVDRYSGCHAKCIRYIDWKQKHDVELSERREKYLTADAIHDNEYKRIKKLKQQGGPKCGRHRHDSRQR